MLKKKRLFFFSRKKYSPLPDVVSDTKREAHHKNPCRYPSFAKRLAIIASDHRASLNIAKMLVIVAPNHRAFKEGIGSVIIINVIIHTLSTTDKASLVSLDNY